MPKVLLSDVIRRATDLGFQISVTSVGYRVTRSGTGLGYQGSLDGCVAYLQGWAEAHTFQSLRW